MIDEDRREGNVCSHRPVLKTLARNWGRAAKYHQLRGRFSTFSQANEYIRIGGSKSKGGLK
jgi:hypothetical protein